jgi:hypothetical protein
MADAKLSDPLPTAASPSTMTVLGAPAATVLIRKLAGVPEASPVAEVIVEKVSRPADAEPAIGLLRGRDARSVPGSALKVPDVFPLGLPEKTAKTAVDPAAVTMVAILEFLTVSWYDSAIVIAFARAVHGSRRSAASAGCI